MSARISAVLAALAAIAVGTPASAALNAVVTDQSGLIVLKPERDAFYERVVVEGLYQESGQMGVAPCPTVGSKYLPVARSDTKTAAGLVARYNMVRLWLGLMCDGVSDALPEPGETRAWIKDLSGGHFSDGRRLLDTDEMVVGYYLFGARGDEPDYAKARAFLQVQDDKFFIERGVYLAYIYEHGLGVPTDHAAALKWLQHAASLKSWKARVLLAQNLELGIDGPKDEAAAARDYAELSKGIVPPAQFRLGLMYLDGRGVPADACKARELLQRAGGHHWSPVAQAKPYLDRIEREKLCPKVAPAPGT